MDTSSKSALLKLVLPHVPYLTRTALWHTLYLSPTSTKWDLKTEIIIKLIRAILSTPSSNGALHRQQATLKDPGIRGKIWISKVTFPASENSGLLHRFYGAIDELKGSPADTYTVPTILPVEAEWTGYRLNVDAYRPRPDLSEAQHFQRLMGDTSTPITLLYFHGGAFVMMDPSSHRQPVSHLCNLTGGRALSVRYRLSPQSAFPAALLDSYIAYLSLLYPPPNSFHEPVKAKHIIFAGDSAGGNLCLALTQLLLQLNRSATAGEAFQFQEHTVALPLPLPAGIAGHSPWLDMTHCFPSKWANAKYDYLPPPMDSKKLASMPHDSIWPADPPRGDLYCDTSMLCHPLVSPAAARDWRGAPPLWLAYGEEMLVDEGKQVAQLAARQGTTVIWEEWEGMCHCFGMVLVGSPMSKRFFNDWASFCRTVGGGDNTGAQTQEGSHKEVIEGSPMEIKTRGTFFEVKTGKEGELDVMELGALGEEEVLNRMQQCMAKRQMKPEEAARSMPKL